MMDMQTYNMNEDNPEIINRDDLRHIAECAAKDNEWIIISPRGLLYKGDLDKIITVIYEAKNERG